MSLPTQASADVSRVASPLPGFTNPGINSTIPMENNNQNAAVNDMADMTIDAANYGTRSRGRPNRARVNYADDKEIDLEIEATGKYAKPSKKTPANTTGTDFVTSQNGTKAGLTAINGDHTTIDPTNSNTIEAGNPASSSKKRKQPGSSTIISTTVPQPVSTFARPPTNERLHYIDNNMLSFTKTKAKLNGKGQLVADDGTVVSIDDHAYFVCEPPGEPYYLGRIMEFLHVSNDPKLPVDSVRVNWFYRPKDIQRRVQDSRVVFASMHSDTSPLTSIRGKCTIKHINDITDFEEFRKQMNSFWFEKLYDRYMHRYYEVIPTSKVVNVPKHVKAVLDERWKFVLVEVGRGRDLTNASKICKRCTDFAANHNSVDCAICKNTYHMGCVKPPLLRKPARGFAWACAACNRVQELKLEARSTPTLDSDTGRLTEQESLAEEEDLGTPSQEQATRENSAGPEIEHRKPTAAQLAQASLWQWRYLGVHSKPEDALDIDDRIYPRASSRLGPRHQANVNVWHGRPVEFIKAAEGKKKYRPGINHKKDSHKSQAAIENDKREKRPKWVYDEPPGYMPRGGDEKVETTKGRQEYTSQLIFRMPEASKLTERGLDNGPPENYEKLVDAYMSVIDREIEPLYGKVKGQTDIRTKALEKLQEHDYDSAKALDAMRHLSPKTDLKLPELNKEEVRKFEEGVAKYGSELHLVARHISATMKEGRIVRFYYMWKKTPKGREIWSNFEGRKSKKDQKKVDKDGNIVKLVDDVAHDVDDSAFDNEKAAKTKRGFVCKFCDTKNSRFWRRAPGTAPGTLVPRDGASKQAKDRSSWLTLALCGKCAYLWRRYAVQYESIDEIGKKIAVSGGRASTRKNYEDLIRIVVEGHHFAADLLPRPAAQIALSSGIDVPQALIESDEPLKKKPKVEELVPPAAPVVVEKKKIVPEKPIELEPLKPELPRVKEHPCAVCHVLDAFQYKILKCRDCRLHVHAPCYGVSEPEQGTSWYCDMCKNDQKEMVSTNYECVLCPVRTTTQELFEPPKVSHKKKTDREREKERAEREMVAEAGKKYREGQLAAGRPVDPHEPLKRTAWNNWMHVNCAVWTKEIKFGDAEQLDAAEGVGFIPEERFKIGCKFCKREGLPTTTCQFPACTATFHVGCAHQAGLTFGFDITPVKVSRRDSVSVMKLDQEAGLAVPGIWCNHHVITTIVHSMLEPTTNGLTALQEYVRTYKQVDTSIMGTVRRAAQFDHKISGAPSPHTANNHHSIITNGNHQSDTANGHGLAASPSPLSPVAGGISTSRASIKKSCCVCEVRFSPKWWPFEKPTVEVGTSRDVPVVLPSSQETRHDPDIVLRVTASPRLLSDTKIKVETTDIITLDLPGGPLFRCQKCHVNKRLPKSMLPPTPPRQRSPSFEEIHVRPVSHHGIPNGFEQHPGMMGPPQINGATPFHPNQHLWPGPPPVINGIQQIAHPALMMPQGPPQSYQPQQQAGFSYPYPAVPVPFGYAQPGPPPQPRPSPTQAHFDSSLDPALQPAQMPQNMISDQSNPHIMHTNGLPHASYDAPPQYLPQPPAQHQGGFMPQPQQMPAQPNPATYGYPYQIPPDQELAHPHSHQHQHHHHHQQQHQHQRHSSLTIPSHDPMSCMPASYLPTPRPGQNINTSPRQVSGVTMTRDLTPMDLEGRSSTIGTGASASPSLKNLLS